MFANPVGLIILEGPDGAGKTTLGQKLCELYDGIYIHRTYAKDLNIWDHHTEALRIAQEQSHERLVVIDRLWPSELIYGRVFRGGSPQSEYNARSMDRVVLRMAGLYVICLPNDVETIVRTHAEKRGRGEEMFESVREVAVRYADWLKGSVVRPIDGDLVEQISALGGMLQNRHHDVFHYDFTTQGQDLKEVCRRIIGRVKALRRTQYPDALDPAHQNFLGNIKYATHLFVGEQLGDPDAWSRWPFYGHTNCADFLNRSLHRIAWPEQLGVWTNAINSDPQIKKIVDAKPELKVIALGGIAERRCKQHGIAPRRVHHPQWARRFNNHGQNGKSYAHELAEVTT